MLLPSLGIWRYALSTVILFGGATFFYRLITREPFEGLGIPQPWGERFSFLQTALGIAVVTFVLLWATSWLRDGCVQVVHTLPHSWGDKILSQWEREVRFMAQLKAHLSWREYVVFAMVPALFEELFMRGVLQGYLVRVLKSVQWGIVVTSLLFALLHFSVVNLLPIFLLSIWLGVLRYHTRSLWWGVAVHLLNNILALSL